jgi:hypothetical protein
MLPESTGRRALQPRAMCPAQADRPRSFEIRHRRADEKGRWHYKLEEKCAHVNDLVIDDATHVGDRGDGGCGRKRCREGMQGEKTDAGHPKRYLPREPRCDLQQIGEGDGLSGSSHGAISIREVGQARERDRRRQVMTETGVTSRRRIEATAIWQPPPSFTHFLLITIHFATDHDQLASRCRRLM